MGNITLLFLQVPDVWWHDVCGIQTVSDAIVRIFPTTFEEVEAQLMCSSPSNSCMFITNNTQTLSSMK